MVDALADFPIFAVGVEDVARVGHGVPLEVSPEQHPGRVRVVGPDGALLAVADVRQGRLIYVRWPPVNVTVLVPPRCARRGTAAQLDLGACRSRGGRGAATLLTLYPKLRSAMASETRLRRQQLTVVMEPRSGLRGQREGLRVWLFAPAAASERA
jgi:hypothetical protein